MHVDTRADTLPPWFIVSAVWCACPVMHSAHVPNNGSSSRFMNSGARGGSVRGGEHHIHHPPPGGEELR